MCMFNESVKVSGIDKWFQSMFKQKVRRERMLGKNSAGCGVSCFVSK